MARILRKRRAGEHLLLKTGRVEQRRTALEDKIHRLERGLEVLREQEREMDGAVLREQEREMDSAVLREQEREMDSAVLREQEREMDSAVLREQEREMDSAAAAGGSAGAAEAGLLRRGEIGAASQQAGRRTGAKNLLKKRRNRGSTNDRGNSNDRGIGNWMKKQYHKERDEANTVKDDHALGPGKGDKEDVELTIIVNKV